MPWTIAAAVAVVPPLDRLQLDDALHHLRAVEAREVVPLTAPRVLPYASAALLLAALLLAFSGGAKPVAARPSEPLAVVVARARQRVDPARPSANDPPLLRVDPPPSR